MDEKVSVILDGLSLQEIPCPIYLVQNDSYFTILWGNATFYGLLGYTPQELRQKYGNHLSAIQDAESLKRMNELSKDEDEAGPVFLRQRLRKQDGSESFFATSITVKGCGRTKVFCCFASDITSEMLNEQAFGTYRAVSQFVTEQSDFEVFVYDFDTRRACLYTKCSILRCLSQGGENLSKLPDISVIPKFPETVVRMGLVHPEDVSAFLNTFESFGQSGDKSACELRMRGSEEEKYAWIRFTLAYKKQDDSSEARTVGVLEDITPQKAASLQYLYETQFFRALLSEKDAYAQVDVTEDRIEKAGGLWNIYNEIISKVTYSDLILEFINKVVHPEDRAHYIEVMQRDNFNNSLENGVNRLGCEFRRIVEQNKMIWMELSVYLFRDPVTRHVLALLCIKNIDKKKRQELVLTYNSERDPLTNLLHKKTAEASICAYLDQMGENDVSAFMILDLDDFKHINDRYGHKAGDQVLVRLVDILSAGFRRHDIIGRFGGDEFILFLKDIGSKEKVRERLDNVYEQLKKENDPPISCSIGVALIRGPMSYETAFQRADAALYTVKSKEKGSAAFYLDIPEEDLPRGERISIITKVDEKRSAVPLIKKEIPNPAARSGAQETADGSFDLFLSEQGDIAYLVDPDSFLLICGNKAFYERIGKAETECIGMKCYEAVQKRSTPCPFCSKANWSTDKFYLWKNLNEALEQEFLVKNKLVQWRGREVLLAIAVDISNDKSIADSLENDVMESHSILSGIQQMEEAPDLSSAVSNALETMGYFFRADIIRLWERRDPGRPYENNGTWVRSGRDEPESPDQRFVTAWLESRKWDQPIMIESPEAMLSESYDLYRYMCDNGIYNQRWVRLRDGEHEIGCICIANISSNFQNIAFLESFAVFVAGEIKKRRLMEEILYANHHDDLTGLLNRNSYEKFLQAYKSDEYASVGVMVANLDNLKRVNSNVGFHVGNFYLQTFAEILRGVFREGAAYRLNGDEFLVIVLNIRRNELEMLVSKVEEQVAVDGSFTVSIGHSWDNVENDMAVLIEQATQAMRVNKKRHYDQSASYDDGERRSMLHGVVEALEKRCFEVFLQPKVELDRGRVVGAEALVRYRHEKLGIIPPAKFVDTLENNGFIRYVDLFVFEEVCKLMEEWQNRGIDISVSLNFSRLTLLERDILSSMENIISKYDVSRKKIDIEITESFADMGKSILFQAVHDLKEAGFTTSLDDFGTKYTNLSILADIDFSVIKLDKSLTNALVKDKNIQIILKNVIQMCHDLRVDVIAEGVETKGQEAILNQMDCRLGQGYLYGKPMPIADFEKIYLPGNPRC